MSLKSCIYEGEVRHRRFRPIRREFHHRLFLMYVDLDEIATVCKGRWLWSWRRPNLAWFRRADHLGPADQPLDESVRDLVLARTGRRPSGPIRLLTHFRYFGFAMNPISIYYCFDRDEQLDFAVAEVTNTPWGRRICYVLDVAEGGETTRGFTSRAAKEMHVSPFLGMDFDYEFLLTSPGSSLLVHIENQPRDAEDPSPIFDATLRLTRRPLSGTEMARVLVRFPAMTLQVFARIYAQALRLWLAGVPYHHPPTSATTAEPASRAGFPAEDPAGSSTRFESRKVRP